MGEAAKLHGKDGILNGSRWFDKIYKVAGIGIKFLRGGMMNREEVERMQDGLKAERSLNKLIFPPHPTFSEQLPHLVKDAIYCYSVMLSSSLFHLPHLRRQLCFKLRLSWVEYIMTVN